MRITTVIHGYEVEVEVDVEPGFTVHNQDGTSAKVVHLRNSRIVGGPPPNPGGPGEPLPKPERKLA